jgi:hypothetical protein
MWKTCQDQGRPRVTSDRDDRALQRLVRPMPFATSPVLKQHWLPNRRLSTRTVRNHLKSAELKSRRFIKRPLLVDRHRRTRLVMVFSTTWLESKDMAQDPLVRREPVSPSCNRRPDEGLETQIYSLYPKEHPANCPLRWRLSNGLGVYLSWLQAGFSHHTRQPNWWSVHQRRLATSCCPPFWQPPTSYKACVYDQASSFKSSNRLPPKRSHDLCSLTSHESGFESNRAYLGHVRPSYTCSGTSCAKHTSVGSSIASGIAAAITTGHPTSNWRDETQGWGRHPSRWGLHQVLNFEQ